MNGDQNNFVPAGLASTSQDSCRVCGADLYEKPLLFLKNMPAAAQNFPDASTVDLDSGQDLEVNQCTACGLVQLSNPPVIYYRDVIRASAFSDEMGRFRQTQFESFVGKWNLGGKKVLEVGCGKGEFVRLMANAGAQAFGLENLKASVDHCHENGLSVSQGYLTSTNDKVAGAPFDAFFIMNFFEHIPDPLTTLRAVAANLNDEAVGLVEVPNFDMILRNRLFSEFINDHLFYFTRSTLESTLNLGGFEVLSCESIWYDYILSAVVRKKRPLDTSALETQQVKIAGDLHVYIDARPGKQIAVWGAGHQALAVLSLSELGNDITVVLDSAPFKQGKFTPATHIPIVDPSVLREGNIGAVVVMAAGYSDEVVGILQTEYAGLGLEIAVLRDHGLEIIRAIAT